MTSIALLIIGEKGFAVLSSFVESYGAKSLNYVISAYDEGVDNDYSEEIRNLCERHGILHRNRLENNEDISGRMCFKFAIGWKWILPASEKTIIIHDSLLPKYRGFAPLVNCLITGEKEIGATALFASPNYDRGPIISQKSKKINYPIKIADAIDTMKNIYVEIVLDLANKIFLGQALSSVPQNESEATYSLWRDDADYWIDWTQSSGDIARFVDSLGSPYRGARTMLNDVVVIVKSVVTVSDVSIQLRESAIGKIIFMEDGKPVVVCGAGLLKLNEIFGIDGKKVTSMTKFRSRFGGQGGTYSV